MKSIKKILSYLLVITIVIVCSTEGVWADSYFPSYNSDISSKIKDSYCIYSMGKVFDVNTSSFEGGHYTNSQIYLTASNGKIYFIHPGNKDKDAGVLLSGGSKWDYTWFDSKKVEFDSSDLADYLIDSNNKLVCKELNFYEVNSNLQILTPEDYNKHNVADRTPAYSGTLMYQGVNSEECEDYKDKVTNLYNQWKNNTTKNQAVSFINNLKNANEYMPGQLTGASNQKAIFDAEYAKVKVELDTLLKSDVDLATCQKYNKSKTELAKLEQAIYSDYNNMIIGFGDVKSNYDAAVAEATANNDTERLALLAQESDIAQQALDDLNKKLEEIKAQFENYLSSFDFGTKITDGDCEGLLGPELLDDISTILTWIRIAVPILLILLGSVDFAKAVLSDDQQELKKCTGRFVKRCIIAVAIFFIPSIIMYLLSFIDKIADVSCDIRLW